MKKSTIAILSTSAALLVALPFAANAAQPTLGDGFFVGASGSYSNTNFGYTDTTLAAGQTTQNQHVSKFHPNVFAGFGSLFADDNTYLGLRVGSTIGSIKSGEVEKGAAGNIKVEESQIFYADVMPGLVLNNQRGLLYLVAGGEHAKFKLSGASSNSDSAYGWRLGGGYEFALTNHIGLDLEAVYTGFNKVAFNKPGNNGRYQLKPHNEEVSLGITFSFDGGNDANQNGGDPFLAD